MSFFSGVSNMMGNMLPFEVVIKPHTVNKEKMGDLNVNKVLNMAYDEATDIGVAAGVSMVLQRFFKLSLGAPASLKSMLTLTLMLLVGKIVKDYAWKKLKLPTEPFKKE